MPTAHFRVVSFEGMTDMKTYDLPSVSLCRVSIFVLGLCCTGLSMPAWGDQVVLKNGDRVSGSLVKKDAKSLTIKTDGLRRRYCLS